MRLADATASRGTHPVEYQRELVERLPHFRVGLATQLQHCVYVHTRTRVAHYLGRVADPELVHAARVETHRQLERVLVFLQSYMHIH